MVTIKEAIEKFVQEYNNADEEKKQFMGIAAGLEQFKWEKIYEFVKDQER